MIGTMIFEAQYFDIWKVGRDRYFVKLKGGMIYAHPAPMEISRENAEEIIQAETWKQLAHRLRPMESPQEAEAQPPAPHRSKSERRY